MIQQLAGVVEDAARGGCLDNLFEGFARIFGAFDEFIQRVDVVLEVFTVVKLDRLLADYGFQRIRCVGKFGHVEAHKCKADDCCDDG